MALLTWLHAGYWSSGQRLSDSTRVVGDGVDAADFPEYVVCALFSSSYLCLSSLTKLFSAEVHKRALDQPALVLMPKDAAEWKQVPLIAQVARRRRNVSPVRVYGQRESSQAMARH